MNCIVEFWPVVKFLFFFFLMYTFNYTSVSQLCSVTLALPLLIKPCIFCFLYFGLSNKGSHKVFSFSAFSMLFYLLSQPHTSFAFCLPSLSLLRPFCLAFCDECYTYPMMLHCTLIFLFFKSRKHLL